MQVLANINYRDVYGGRPAELAYCILWPGGAEPQEGGGLARAWTDWQSVRRCLGANSPMKRIGVHGGDRGHGIAVLLRFASS